MPLDTESKIVVYMLLGLFLVAALSASIKRERDRIDSIEERLKGLAA